MKKFINEYKGLILFALTIFIGMQLAAYNVEKMNEQENNKTQIMEER